jgi:hypothetical protein
LNSECQDQNDETAKLQATVAELQTKLNAKTDESVVKKLQDELQQTKASLAKQKDLMS